jgi:RHS repeat-associated protein
VQNNLLSGYDITSTVYTFSNKPSGVTHTHTASGKTTRTEVYTYTYDHADRINKVQHSLGSTAITLYDATYDNFGRLLTKQYHGTSTNKLTYTYNLRSWLTGISGTRFTQNLYYNTGVGTAKYNGSISNITWKSGNESTVRGYKFTYDGLDRVLNATYGETASISTNANRFSENVTGYDKNGNIKSLQRYGQTGASAYGLIDNLTYTLTGNQLSRVDDAVSTAAYGTNTAFVNGASAAGEYAYDANGNLTKDLNKGITDIQYNVLNLPSTVSFSDGSTITYTYGADGTKLRTVHKIGSTTTTTDYCGNVIYENGTQKLLLTEEGYINLTGTQQYHYYLKDHQGNNRVVINQSGTVEETNHYYPFGGVFGTTGNTQPYKYNGKEFDTKKGLNWYDYGARYYDAALGRFTTVDPSSENYYAFNPYSYCVNNPIKYIDPDGKDFIIWYKDSNGKQAYFSFNGKNAAMAPNNSFVNAVVEAYFYNSKNGGGEYAQKIVTNAKLKVGIVESDKDNRFDSSGFIRFNPNAGLKLNDGNILSPATGLEHEAAHAFNMKTNKVDESPDTRYGTKEERSVIQGAELKTAKANGELPLMHKGRIKHSEGQWVVTKSVTSNVESSSVESQELRNRIFKFRNSWTSE